LRSGFSKDGQSAGSAKCSLFKDIRRSFHFLNVPLQAFSGRRAHPGPFDKDSTCK
jgi:hypothetical protein